MPAAQEAVAKLGNIINSGSINPTNYKPAYKFWKHLSAKVLAEEGRYQDAAAALNDIDFIKNKLGYWSTPYDFAFFFDEVGQIYERMRKHKEAESYYLAALAYNPHYALAQFHLARFYKSRGNHNDARRELQSLRIELMKADPDMPEVALMRQMRRDLRMPD
jgi:tetratricopeptide (TPR) repeat protein